jgi:hypothetical protein
LLGSLKDHLAVCDHQFFFFLAFYVVHVISKEKKMVKGKAIPITGHEGQ